MEGKYLTVADFNKVLPAEVKAIAKVIDLEKQTSTRIFFAKYGVVDFSKLSVNKARYLISIDFPYLKSLEKAEK